MSPIKAENKIYYGKEMKKNFWGCPTFAPLTLCDQKLEIKPEWIEEWLKKMRLEYRYWGSLSAADLTDFLNKKLNESYLPYHDSKESKLVDGEIVEED